MNVTLHDTTTTSFEAGAKATASGKATLSHLEAGVAGSANASSSKTATRKVDVAQTGGGITVTQSKTPDGHYRWTLQPTLGSHLEGRGWDANKAPRLKVEDRREDRSTGIPPVIHVEVRCKREDMIIEDLEVKDAAAWERIRETVGFDRRMAAAEAYIRSRLASEGLEFGDLGEDFADLTVASVICDAI